MNLLFMDYETMYDSEYSLQKMTPLQYILDPRFESLGCSFKHGFDHPAYWVDGPDLPDHMAEIDWSNSYAVSHNALFDALITSIKYGYKPKMYGCTLSMARNWIAHSTGKVSLAACASYFGLPAKMTTLARTKGVTFAQLLANPTLHEEVKVYGNDDDEKCAEIFKRCMAQGFPPSELHVIDWVVRMAADPKFILDPFLLAEHLAEIRAHKAQLLINCGQETRDGIMRDGPLAMLLMAYGVDPPKKLSKTNGNEIFAFAKTDKEFTDLLDHENPDVQAIVAARLGHKSTIEETRTERLLVVSMLDWQDGAANHSIPVPLKYSGAHTHRFSGDWLLNLQNLTRGSKLRDAMKVPNGKKAISIDASQIEARFNASLAGQEDLVEAFRQGVDVYAQFAEDIWHKPINKAEFPMERFVGKTGILSLGYGSSDIVFRAMVRNKSGGMFSLDPGEAAYIVRVYRNKMHQIVALWKYADWLIEMMMTRMEQPIQWGPLEVHYCKIRLPNGNWLYYRNLRKVYDQKTGRIETIYDRGQIPTKLYGAKLVENVIQALAFVHIAEVAMKVKFETKGLLLPAHQVHDELIYVENEHLAAQIATYVIQEISRPPAWMPDAPLAAEAGIGDSYGDCK
jgi:DNA polymerase bacteriophage-type